MEGTIDMAARRQVTNKLRSTYAGASKKNKGLILGEVMANTGMGRSTARRMLTGPALASPRDQVDRRRLKPRTYSDDARALLEHVWVLMGMPCGKYLLVMLDSWLPLLADYVKTNWAPFHGLNWLHLGVVSALILSEGEVGLYGFRVSGCRPLGGLLRGGYAGRVPAKSHFSRSGQVL